MLFIHFKFGTFNHSNFYKPLKTCVMKNLLLSLFIIFFGATLIISCTKTDLNNPAALTQDLKSNGKVNPDVPYCGIGNHWDFYLGKCVETCPTGYHNDSITGACVVDQTQNITVITNPNNPEDYVGSLHNSGCDYILPKISFNSPTVYSDLLYQDKVYVISKGYDSTDVSKAYLGGSQTGYLFNPDSTYTNNPGLLISKLYSAGEIGSTAENYFNTIIDDMDIIIGNNLPSSGIYNSFANTLINLENQINNDYTLSNNEHTVLLSACSVARYSAAYWGEYYLNENTGGIGNSVVRPLFLGIHIKINWRKVLGADIVGAIGGFFGSIFSGGVAVVGALGGAIGGSIGEGIIENTNLQ